MEYYKRNFNNLIKSKKYKMKYIENLIINKQDKNYILIKKLLKKHRIISKNIYKLEVLNEKLKNNRRNGDWKLTKREKEVYKYIVKGLTNKQISEILYITENTLKKHVSNILSKLNEKSRSGIISAGLKKQRVGVG